MRCFSERQLQWSVNFTETLQDRPVPVKIEQYGWHLQYAVMTPLVYYLCRNKSLVRMALVFDSVSSTPACLNELARCLSYNGYVVKLTMTDSKDADWTTKAISRIVHRNSVMLDRAASFVLHRKWDKRSSRDFHYLQAAASLVPHVVLLSRGTHTVNSAIDAVMSAKSLLRGLCSPLCLRSVSWPLLPEHTATSVGGTPHSV